MDAASPMIELRFEGAVAVATLCRAPVNAISDEWIDALQRVLDAVECRADVSVLWLRSSQKVFCAGADLALMSERFVDAAGRGLMIALTRRMQEVYSRLEHSRQVTIAEIGGHALGGGFELALACDLRIVSDSAKIGLPEARLGLLPAAGGTQRMTRLVGDAMARRLILGAEVVLGADAVALGLVHWSAPAAELPVRARELVERIAVLPAHALSACKRCVGAAIEQQYTAFETELEASDSLLASELTQNLVHRFLKK
jgi:enoyl-CoA hydratase/carnithine racemase